jgi:cytochrome c-type biogenesis protein
MNLCPGYAMSVQAELSQWLGQVAEFLPFGYAFGAGMVSAVNPCGFALLPVYLTLYLGADDSRFRSQSLFLRLLKAFWIALVVASGFALLFGIFGLIVSAGGTFLMEIMPWLTVVVGLLLMLLGAWMLFGHTLSLHFVVNLAGKIGDPREMSVFGFFLFGLAFGATSLGCTLPIFLMVIGNSLTAGDFTTGSIQFFSYILGMGSVLQILTLGIAVVKEGVVVGALRRMLPYVQKVSALLLLGAGGYSVFYWLSTGGLLS